MSNPAKLAQFVEAVRASGLLSAVEMTALAEAASQPDADAEALARDLVQRGLLTAYQVRRLWTGRGPELVLNQYVLLERVGEGGMGEVFRARHATLDREVALKIMRKEKLAKPGSVKRFQREIRAAATLAHENVVMAYDADQSGDVHYFAMEFVDGTTLDQMVKDRGPIPVAEACEYIRQAALGLQHAFEKGLTHRDIKPANLLVDKAGVVKISDLGLVLIEEPDNSEGASRITKEGLTVGTPDFVAPEQARNPRAADVRADIYALGCTLYYLLAGDVPFPGGTPTEKMLRHARESIPVPTRPDVPLSLRAVVATMTARKPEHRYQTPAAVASALEEFASPTTPRTTPLLLPAIPESLTEEELPAPANRTPTDSRFQLPAEKRPKARKAGCLGVVLLGAAIGVAIGRLV